jgi:carboxypeptidase C (cathepsin A)
MVSLLLAALSWVRLAEAAPAADLVDALPGWSRPLLSKTYSGYIAVGSKDNATTMYEHYLYFESERDPKNDPLIMWTNGGPGASSFFGSFSELGPYYVSDASLNTAEFHETGVPTLFENVNRWTKLGNLLIRNLPPPVGFSYCDPAGPTGDGFSCGPWNDSSVAEHSYNFLKNWVEQAFPELQSHDLYLVGESYAGIYVPMLANQITDVHPDGALAKMLRGVAVGDGCTSGLTCTKYPGPYFTVQFFYGHGQFSTKTYEQIQSVCSKDELLNGVSPSNKACKAALDRMDVERGYSFAYNLYDECYDFDLSGAAAARKWYDGLRVGGPAVNGLESRRAIKAAKREAQRRASAGPGQISADDWHMDGSPCGGTDVLPEWTKAPAVRKALHVAPDANFFTGDNGVGFTYKGTEAHEHNIGWYKRMAARNSQNKGAPGKQVRVLIYNGDADPGLNSFVGEDWTRHDMGLDEVEAWRPWTRDGKQKMGGYVTRYDGNFDYVTIRGSGHMVPELKPEAASVMLRSFINNEDYPSLQKPGSLKTESVSVSDPSAVSIFA